MDLILSPAVLQLLQQVYAGIVEGLESLNLHFLYIFPFWFLFLVINKM